ncbi:polymer-forming cytoskeletal protein [Flavobacterium sp. ANB]|uniref:bactofilin family protein n=1 Tax=unclassified Flavobacterium TaxID=196869 RepID=UPI0012B83EE5|nr:MULTISPECIES: polymer-forming cytoskeletal protein [unclassified Flavobacterium]MBF4515287.1 polymer-forming cytoskeletal protein [Flavobacterium sp. ANB]MTD70199.1 polymer-forming cytoskeletal protein [Flavobacterium sp. LC2016-13]
MFDKVKKNGTELLGKTNRIVEGTSIIGDIVSKADFRLDGELIGNFTSQGKLVIGASGVIKGEIICNNADIEGIFQGKIKVLEVLNIKASAHIHGEVAVGKLSIEPGAEFTATCTMLTNTNNEVTIKDGKGAEPKLKE